MKFNWLSSSQLELYNYRELETDLKAPFQLSFRKKITLLNLKKEGTKTVLVKLSFYLSQLNSFWLSLVSFLGGKYRQLFWITEEMKQQILYFIEEPIDTDPQSLSGYKRKEYKRYQKFLTKKQKVTLSSNIPNIPYIFNPKTGILNYEEIIEYFKNLYSQVGEKNT